MNESQGMNLTMLADFYELTMANGYFQNGLHEKTAVFDMFFRSVPMEGDLPSWQEWSSWWNI